MPIDAGLLTALPVAGSGSSSDDYASVLAQQSGAPADVVHAILGTEQSAPNATSVDNARGRMQVTPAAWSQYGIPGVDFSHASPDQLDIAGAKKLADDYKWSGGNPQITAAAYFGGRGGATLFAQGQGATRQDGNGFNINQYVDRFNQKLGSAPTAGTAPRQSLTANTSVGQTASDVDAARQRAKGATLGDALKEVLASGTSAVGDIVHAGGEVLAAGANTATGLPDYSGFNPLTGAATAIRSTMTPGGTAAREDQATGDIDPATWKLPKTFSGLVMSGANVFGTLLPAMIPMIGPAARAARLYEAGSLALKTAQAASDIEGISAAQKMLSEAGSAGLQAKALSGAVEGGMTGGNAAEGTRDDVRQQLAQMTHDQRMQEIPAYAQAFQHYGNDNDASNAVTNSAAQFAGMFSATAGAAGGAFNEKVIEDLIAHKGVAAALGNISSNRAVRTVVGAAAGHVAEAGQEGLEQLGQNVGQNVGLGNDPLQNAGKDMFPNMLGGALIGTPMGAIGGLTSHATHATPAETQQTAPQNIPENISQNGPTVSPAASPVPENTQSVPVQPPPVSFDQLSQQRDQLSARIATLQDVGQRLQGTQSQAAVENEIVGLQQQQRALGEQMQAAVSTGAANPAAAPTPVNDPEAALQTRTRVITDFVADKSVSRELRTQDPQAWSEFLRAYRVALNPTMSSSLRLRALDGIDGYLQQQGFKTSAQGAYERVQQAQPTPANIVPYGANQAELQRGDPQGRMVVDADGNARPASINDVPQPDPNVVPGQVLSSSEGPAPVAPLRADANGVVGTANDFTQLRQQEAQAAATVKRNAIEEALRPRALPAPTLTDAQAASLKQPSALVQEIRAFRLKNSPAMQVEPAATAALTQENENGRKTQTEDQTQANAASGKAETNANALLKPEATNAVTVDEAAHQAASSPLNALPEPTEAQKHAGNYPMGHIRVSGMDISIENPQGSVRSGTDANGKTWSNTLAAHYGYLRGTVGKDKDHIDVFVKPATTENHDGPVFVIDQRKPGNGHLDEHKVMMGFANEGEARKAYQDSYQKGWDGIRAVTEMTTPGFKDWIANGDHTKPAAEYAGNSSEKPNSSITEESSTAATAYSREAAVKTLSDTYANKGADAAAEQFKQIIKDSALSDDEWKALRGEFRAQIQPGAVKSRADASFERQDAAQRSDAKFARSGEDNGNATARELFASPDPQSSVEDVRGEIAGEVDDKAGKVHVVQSITDLPTEQRKDAFKSKALDLQGLFDPKDGSIYLVADNIHKGEAFAVLMHEAGVHLGMRELIGDDAMGTLAKQIKLWSALEKGTEHGDLAARAMERIPEETDPAHRDEELIAYFVTEAVKAGHGDTKQGPIGRWFAKLWAAVKVAVAKLGADPSKLTTSDVVAMARGALERSLGKESAREGEAMDSAKASDLRKTPIVKDNRVNATFTALAKFDEAFQQPTPTATDPVKIAKQIDPGFKVEKLNDFFAADWKDEELPQVWQINSPRPEDGKANLYDDGRRVWVDVSGFKAGESQGNKMYGIAAAYAHNNGKVFIGDPMGLSPVAFFRRLENMISSALRYGTTDHLAPHAAQTNPEKYFRDEAHNPEFAAIAKNFALDWKAGDFAHNLKAMLTTAYNAAKHYVPDLEHLTYDFDRREFVDTRTGEGRSGAALARIFRQERDAAGTPARYFGGSATAARAVLFNTLVRDTGKAGWSGVVAQVGRQLSGDGLDPALKRVLYSRAGNPDDVKPGRAARIEAIINRGAKALPEKMRTQVTEDSTRQIIGESNRDYTPAQREFFANTGRDIETPTLKSKIKSVWQDAGKKVAQGLVDQFAPIKDITEKGYMLARLSKGAAGAFNALLDHGKLSIRDGVYDADQSGGVVERLFKPLQGEGEDFLWWVAANRAERLTGEGRENLFSGDDIAAGKSLDTGTTNFDYTLQHDVGGKAAGTVTRDRTLIYRDSAKVLDEFNRNVMDMAEQSGLIDGEARHIWEHDFYVPFYRVSDEDGSQNFANVKSGLVRQQAFKQLKGGSDKINADIMSNVMSNWAHLIDASAKNRAAQETLSVAESLGIAHKAEPGEKNTVWYQKDGNKVEYKVDDPYLMTAINSMAYSGLRGPMMEAMGAFKHALTVGVTSSPFFKVRNLIRDSLQAISSSGLSYNPAKNIKEGFKASDRKTQSYVSLLASGGIIKFGTMLEGKESARVRRLVKSGVDASTILDSQNKLDAFYAKYIEPAAHAYHEIGERGEEINRAALYQQLLAQGVDHAKAAYEARDLMDFSMQGSWASIRLLTQVVPFMNARLQGLYKLGRAAKDDPRKLGIVLGSVALASIGLMLGYKDDDDWKKREDWDRDNYWWFKVGGEAFRIPKPFEIGAIGSLAERGVELFASDEMTRQRFMDRFTSLLSDNLSMNPIPQLVKPILDVYANKDGFTGRPIETMGMERMRPQDRYTASTSMIARGASTASNALTGVIGKESLSPVQIDELIRGYFGWLGTFVLSSADQLARPASGEPSRPSMDYSKTLSGGMVASLDGASSRYVSQMYDQARTLEEAYGSWKQMLKEGKVDDAADYYADNAGQLALYKHVERTKADAAKLNQQLRSVENSDAAPDEKRDEINRIRDEQDQVARRLSTAR